MPQTDTTGVERPSTLGGPGFVPRERPHAAELGDRWAPFRVGSEVAPLRAVTLSQPGPELEFPEAPGDWLMLGRPPLEQIRAERAALCAAYTALGVQVFDAIPQHAATRPNFLFQRDLYWMTPEGAVLARMAAEQRAGEERAMAEVLAGLGVPILRSLRGRATFEGADALWLDEQTVLLGLGRRTNAEAAAQLRPLLADLGVRLVTAPLGAGVQHTLGAVNLLDQGLAAVLSDRLHPEMRAALTGFDLIELPADHETLHGRAMNFVTVGPRAVVMPARCPQTRARLEAAGVAVVEVDVAAYLLAAGGMACATGVLWRGASIQSM